MCRTWSCTGSPGANPLPLHAFRNAREFRTAVQHQQALAPAVADVLVAVQGKFDLRVRLDGVQIRNERCIVAQDFAIRIAGKNASETPALL